MTMKTTIWMKTRLFETTPLNVNKVTSNFFRKKVNRFNMRSDAPLSSVNVVLVMAYGSLVSLRFSTRTWLPSRSSRFACIRFKSIEIERYLPNLYSFSVDTGEAVSVDLRPYRIHQNKRIEKIFVIEFVQSNSNQWGTLKELSNIMWRQD